MVSTAKKISKNLSQNTHMVSKTDIKRAPHKLVSSENLGNMKGSPMDFDGLQVAPCCHHCPDDCPGDHTVDCVICKIDEGD